MTREADKLLHPALFSLGAGHGELSVLYTFMDFANKAEQQNTVPVLQYFDWIPTAKQR